MRIGEGRGMYEWRKMTEDERKEALDTRVREKYPWHSPPHSKTILEGSFHLSAANFEHKVIIGATPERMKWFEGHLLEVIAPHCSEIYAWSILPNHYHAVVRTINWPKLQWSIGQMHGRLSRAWNLEDKCTGRKMWHRCRDAELKTDKQFWKAMNYVHNNPVKHGYVSLWQEWPYGSVHEFLMQFTREEIKRMWMEYPVGDFGKGWDD